MTTQPAPKTNYCTPDGLCTRPADVPESACTYGILYQTLAAGCVYQHWSENRCLSPFALTAARDQAATKRADDRRKNYRNADGICTAANYTDEASCLHYEAGAANGICIKRGWGVVCCSAEAAKKAVA